MPITRVAPWIMATTTKNGRELAPDARSDAPNFLLGVHDIEPALRGERIRNVMDRTVSRYLSRHLPLGIA